ncbi:MAG: hypothetical protein GKR95_17840 [Gammaproteobacteria bacterium]|nr:hypothetical protein [Gammaproteobacteria bacterium]
MNKLLQEAVEAIEKLPQERQTYLAEQMLIQADEEVEFLQAIDEGIDDADAGRFVSAQEEQALRDKIQAKANAA